MTVTSACVEPGPVKFIKSPPPQSSFLLAEDSYRSRVGLQGWETEGLESMDEAIGTDQPHQYEQLEGGSGITFWITLATGQFANRKVER